MALVSVTDHAVDRYRQRVRGALDPRTEIAARVGDALLAGRTAPGRHGATLVRDVKRPDLVYVCMEDRPRGELVVVTLWEEGEDPAVPRRFTDALAAPRRGRAAGDPGA